MPEFNALDDDFDELLSFSLLKLLTFDDALSEEPDDVLPDVTEPSLSPSDVVDDELEKLSDPELDCDVEFELLRDEAADGPLFEAAAPAAEFSLDPELLTELELPDDDALLLDLELALPTLDMSIPFVSDIIKKIQLTE